MVNQKLRSSSGFASITTPLLPQTLDQAGIIGSIGLELTVFLVLAFDVRALDGDFLDPPLLQRREERGIGDRLLLPILLRHHIEEQNHHQRDNQPECEIFIELIHCTP